MTNLSSKTFLTIGNEAFRRKDYSASIDYYQQAMAEHPEISKNINDNLTLAKRRLKAAGTARTDPDNYSILEELANQIRPFFDEAFYLIQREYVPEENSDLVIDYLASGWEIGLDPHPEFSTIYYLKSNPDVLAAGLNPYWHYVVAGKNEGRLAKLAKNDASDNGSFNDKTFHPGSNEESREVQYIDKIRPHFDERYYLAENPDVARAGIDPIRHYCTHGWREGRNPNTSFSTNYYLESNPDVACAELNPYWHYIVAGKTEGRKPQHPGGYKAEILKTLPSLEETVLLWKKETTPLLLDSDKILSEFLNNKKNNLIIAIGHDDYRASSGGIQLCIHREEEAATKFDASYLNVHPWQPLPRLAKEEDEPDTIVNLILDGRDIGACRMSTLINITYKLSNSYKNAKVVVHSLMGHMPELITQLIFASGKKFCWLWIHDFFTLCPSYSLQRNNISFCGAPDQKTNACHICVFGVERPNHVSRIKAFFESCDVHIASPSLVTKEFWQEKAQLPYASITIAPHMNVNWTRRLEEQTSSDNPKITIGYIGAPAPHKGWHTFQKIVTELSDTNNFRFVYFGNHDIALRGIESFNVHVTSENYAAMVENVAKQEVDFIVHWASCRETFSFATYEALAAGSYIITNPISGNVADTVNRLGRGIIIENEQELINILKSEKIHQLADAVRKTRRNYEITHSISEMTLPLLFKEPE